MSEELDIQKGETIKNIIVEIRKWKSKKGIPLNKEIPYMRILTKNIDKLSWLIKIDVYHVIKYTLRVRRLVICDLESGAEYEE